MGLAASDEHHQSLLKSETASTASMTASTLGTNCKFLWISARFLCQFVIWSFKVRSYILRRPQNFCEIFPLLLTVCTAVKSKGKISQNFVAFSEYMNVKNKTEKSFCPDYFLLFAFDYTINDTAQLLGIPKWYLKRKKTDRFCFDNSNLLSSKQTSKVCLLPDLCKQRGGNWFFY